MNDDVQPEEQVPDYPGVREGSGTPQPLSHRLRDPRTIISIVLPIVLARPHRGDLGNIDFDLLLQSDRQRQPGAAPGGPRRLLPRLPAAWLSLDAAAARCGHGGQRRVIRRRSSSSAGWSTASCRPSWVTSTAPTCCASTSRYRCPHVRHRLHRARARPVRDRAARPRRRLLELPDGHVARSPDRLRHRARSSSALLPSGLFVVRNFGVGSSADCPSAARIVEFYERFEEGLFSIERAPAAVCWPSSPR